MKKYKLVSALLAFIVSTSFVSVPIMAENNSSDSIIYTTVINNETYEFDSYDDYCKFISDHSSEDISLCTSSGTDYVSTLLWSETKSYQWIGYHSLTPNWSKASSYTLTSGGSYSASGSVTSHGYSIGVTVSYTQSASITYSANSSKYSRLGVYADVKVYRYKYDVYEYGTYSYTYYVNGATPTTRYITVVYK